jgi:hypothetical protein
MHPPQPDADPYLLDRLDRLFAALADGNRFTGLEAWVPERKAQWNSQFDRLERYLNGDSA